ncbi:MAG: HesA/MoeB/ThiF family protein, partial [Chloroflexota bacterium]
MDVDLSVGKRIRLPDHETYYRLLTEASTGLIEPEELFVLREAGILVVGCGAVGANVVESLVRAGCEWLKLVDPKTCDIHHLGRMAIDLRSLERNRAEVMAERAADINPFATIEAVPEGITASNASALLDDIDIVIDTLGIESNADLTARYCLHAAAHAQNIPVICGFDVACAGWVLIYDYRDEKQEILDGAFDDEDLDPDVAADKIEILTR